MDTGRPGLFLGFHSALQLCKLFSAIETLWSDVSAPSCGMSPSEDIGMVRQG